MSESMYLSQMRTCTLTANLGIMGSRIRFSTVMTDCPDMSMRFMMLYFSSLDRLNTASSHEK